MTVLTIPAVPSKREARRERELGDRRRDTLQAATEVFAEKGFHDTQISEIAARAELSLASLYAMFDGKEGIYKEVMHSAALRLRDDVRSRLATPADAGARLAVLIDAFFDYFERNRSLLQILLAGTRGLPWKLRERVGEGANEILDEFYRHLVELCREVVEERELEDIDPEALCAGIVGAVTHFAAWVLEEHPERRLVDAAPAVQAIFARVVRNEARP
jgi:AcrR family transcriptional regulator